MQEQILQLIKRIETLERENQMLKMSSTIPLNVDLAFQGRGFIKTILSGILFGNGQAALTSITPLSGTKTYYVSDSSGGAVNRKLTFTSGVLVNEV